jgi:hypothetical protein
MRERNPDDEPDEEMVYVGDTQQISNLSAFHTRECKHFPETDTEVPRTVAESWGLELCDTCAGKVFGVAEDRQGEERDYNELVDKLRDQMGVEVQQ